MTADHTPAAQRSHPVKLVLRDGETFRELARQIEYAAKSPGRSRTSWVIRS